MTRTRWIQNNKLYRIDGATELVTVHDLIDTSTLYQTKSGLFFLIRRGMYGDWQEQIEAFEDKDEVIEWLNVYNKIDLALKLFPDKIVEA